MARPFRSRQGGLARLFRSLSVKSQPPKKRAPSYAASGGVNLLAFHGVQAGASQVFSLAHTPQPGRRATCTSHDGAVDVAHEGVGQALSGAGSALRSACRSCPPAAPPARCGCQWSRSCRTCEGWYPARPRLQAALERPRPERIPRRAWRRSSWPTGRVSQRNPRSRNWRTRHWARAAEWASPSPLIWVASCRGSQLALGRIVHVQLLPSYCSDGKHDAVRQVAVVGDGQHVAPVFSVHARPITSTGRGVAGLPEAAPWCRAPSASFKMFHFHSISISLISFIWAGPRQIKLCRGCRWGRARMKNASVYVEEKPMLSSGPPPPEIQRPGQAHRAAVGEFTCSPWANL